MPDLRRLLTIARKEWRQLRRDVRSLLLAFWIPIQLLLLFGYAISWDVRDIPTAVLDQDQSLASRSLVDAFRSAGYFRIVSQLDSPRGASRTLEAGRARVVLVIPVRFAQAMRAGRPAPLQLLVDGSDANTATISLGYANAIVTTWAARRASLAAAAPQVFAGVVPETRVWYNETLESRKVLVPGLVALIMMMVGSLLTSLAIAREWERGTMEQLVATPVRPAEVVIGKLVPYVAIGLADVAVTLAAGVALFQVPFRGSVLLLFVASLCFLAGMAGIGLAISALAKSQRLAMQLTLLLTYLPGFLLSGAFYDTGAMPAVLRAVSRAVPARYFVEILKGVVLKGVGLRELWADVVTLIAVAVLALALALHSFRKELT